MSDSASIIKEIGKQIEPNLKTMSRNELKTFEALTAKVLLRDNLGEYVKCYVAANNDQEQQWFFNKIKELG